MYEDDESDEIDCNLWLNEVGLGHYAPIFLLNFSCTSKNGNLSLLKLARLQIQNFPAMNITVYEHQKVLLEHIRITLEEKSKRKLQINTSTLPDLNKINTPSTGSPSNSVIFIGKVQNDDQSTETSKYFPRSLSRVGSFLNQRKLLNIKSDHQKDVQGTMSLSPPKRRWSLGKPDARTMALTINNNIMYGVMASNFEAVKHDILDIQTTHLNECKAFIGCEYTNIYFLNKESVELAFFHADSWYRVSVDGTIEGQCAKFGKLVDLNDPNEMKSFKRVVDDVTGIRTKSILCHPLRINRGGGRTVAVISMVNKNISSGFQEEDIEQLIVCIQNITLELETRKYFGLLNLIDSVSSVGKLVTNSKINESTDIFDSESKLANTRSGLPNNLPLLRLDSPKHGVKAQTPLRRCSTGSTSLAGLDTLINHFDLIQMKEKSDDYISPVIAATKSPAEVDEFEMLYRKQERRKSYGSDLRTKQSFKGR